MSNDRSKLLSGHASSYTDVDAQYARVEVTGVHPEHTLKAASNALFLIQAVLVVLFATFAKETYIGNGNFMNVYQLFTGVEIMMFIGFGYLMTFLRRYGMGALGFTLLITVVGLQWGILTEVSAQHCILACTFLIIILTISLFYVHIRPTFLNGTPTYGATSQLTF